MMKFALLVCTFIFFSSRVFSQTPLKEASNSFALYTKDKDKKNLDNAVKKIDAAYATKKDSASGRVNLTRAMIYAAVALIDPEKKSAGKKTALEEANYSFAKLSNPKFIDEFLPEITYVKMQLAAVYLAKGNRESSFYNYKNALVNYKAADSLSAGKIDVINNLAVLSEKVGDRSTAINYYQEIINRNKASVNHYLALANLYEAGKEHLNAIKTLETGRKQYPESKDILFKVINIYAAQDKYAQLLTLLKPALALEKDNSTLLYLAAYAYEMIGENNKALEHYAKVLIADPDNYEANYALGLLHLRKLLKNESKDRNASKAQLYLQKANQINPYEAKTLKSLLILYNVTGDQSSAEEIKSKLN